MGCPEPRPSSARPGQLAGRRRRHGARCDPAGRFGAVSTPGARCGGRRGCPRRIPPPPQVLSHFHVSLDQGLSDFEVTQVSGQPSGPGQLPPAPLACRRRRRSGRGRGTSRAQARVRYGRNELQPEDPTPLWKLVLRQFDDLLVKVRRPARCTCALAQQEPGAGRRNAPPGRAAAAVVRPEAAAGSTLDAPPPLEPQGAAQRARRPRRDPSAPCRSRRRELPACRAARADRAPAAAPAAAADPAGSCRGRLCHRAH